MRVTFEPIGIVHSPFLDIANMPIQPTTGDAQPGSVEVFSQFSRGLKDLQGFSHIYLIYFLHKAEKRRLLVKPFLDDQLRGVFATRAPVRPNAIGLSLVQVKSIHRNLIEISTVDVLDGTPLLDIKPYVPDFDRPAHVRIGWLAGHRGEVGKRRSDSRFA